MSTKNYNATSIPVFKEGKQFKPKGEVYEKKDGLEFESQFIFFKKIVENYLGTLTTLQKGHFLKKLRTKKLLRERFVNTLRNYTKSDESNIIFNFSNLK